MLPLKRKKKKMFISDLPPKELENSALTGGACFAPAVCAGDICLGTASRAGSEDKPTLQGKPAQTQCKIASANQLLHGQVHFM